MVQTPLDRFADPDDRSGGIRDFLTNAYGYIRNTLADVGIDTSWWGESPWDITDTGEDIWVYQYVDAYSGGELKSGHGFAQGQGENPLTKGSPSPEVQFKTGIYVIGEPTEELKNRIKTVDNARLVTMFDTREYAGYMSGFGFQERREYTQLERVSQREAAQKGGLGVPWFEVEAYDENGELAGYADGTFNPFTTENKEVTVSEGEDPPQEVWRVRTGLNRSRGAGGQWEVGPRKNTAASKRARQASGKDVYIGPFKIGTVTQRGTTWLRREYANGGKYSDKATITSQSGIPPQALQKGAKLYKYKETSNSIHLSTTKPATGYDPVDADDVSEDALGEETTTQRVTDILLDEDEPTQFTVKTDEQVTRLLGVYDPPVVRDIDQGRRLV